MLLFKMQGNQLNLRGGVGGGGGGGGDGGCGGGVCVGVCGIAIVSS